MSKSAIVSVAVAALMATATPLLAQTTAPSAPAASKVAIPANVFYRGQTQSQYFAKDRLIGANLVGKDGVVLGDIEDVLLNVSNNQIEGVLVGTGGVLGMAEKKVAVRYSALQFAVKDGLTTITLPNITKEIMAALEPFQRTEKKSLIQKARDRVMGITERTKQDAGPAYEKAKEAGAAALEKSKELGKAAVEKGKEVIDAAKEKAAPTAPKQ